MRWRISFRNGNIYVYGMHYEFEGRTVVGHREDLFKKRGIWFIDESPSCFVSYFTAGEKATVRLF